MQYGYRFLSSLSDKNQQPIQHASASRACNGCAPFFQLQDTLLVILLLVLLGTIIIVG